MANDLASILDQDGNAALVEEYLLETFQERRDYDCVLADSRYAQEFRLADKSGQYLKTTQKGRLRMPQNLQNSAQTSDPASGAVLNVVQRKYPMEYLQEYLPIATTAEWTSWIDLEAWAKEDLPIALKRRLHQLAQNAFKVGRYQPGKWSSTPTVATTAFDTTAEATPTINGVSFTFNAAPAYFVGRKTAFSQLSANDRHSMADYQRIRVAIMNAGGRTIDGNLIVVASHAVADDLMEDDRYFAATVHAWGGNGLREGRLMEYKGIYWVMDDEPFTENWDAAGVRATSGPVHTSVIFGKSAFARLKLGGKSAFKPKFKIQDVSKTGVEWTIGYMVPMQHAVSDPDWCATLTGPVSNPEANNS